MTDKIFKWIAGIALVLSVLSFFWTPISSVNKMFGAAGGMLAENYIPYIMYNDGYASAKEITTSGLLESTGTFTVGANGSAFAEIKSTTCNLATYELALEATSTDAFYCAVTGLASGDQVFVTLPSPISATLPFGGFFVAYARASTTPDGAGIEVGITNLTGAATSTFPQATTSVQVVYFDN